MELACLQESHRMKTGDNVQVTDRSTNDSYNGNIYNVVILPLNELKQQHILVPYFYVQFSDTTIYSKLLKRGSKIIYNNNPCVVGNIIYEPCTDIIKRIYIQYPMTNSEAEIQFDQINAMLIWRVAYEITFMSGYSIINSRL